MQRHKVEKEFKSRQVQLSHKSLSQHVKSQQLQIVQMSDSCPFFKFLIIVILHCLSPYFDNQFLLKSKYT